MCGYTRESTLCTRCREQHHNKWSLRGYIIYFFCFFWDLLILYQRVRAVLPRSLRQDDILLMVFATLLKSFVSSTSRNVAAGLQERERHG